MSNSTIEYWEIDGISLSQYAWAVKSFGGSPRSLPPLRGVDVTMAYRAGQEFRPKVADARQITLEMWNIGIDPTDESYAPADGTHVQWSNNFRYLQRLFFTPRRQVLLTRRWETSEGLLVGHAYAQIASDMSPDMTGDSRSDFSVSLNLADPFFYGEEVETTLEYGDVQEIENPGDDVTSGFSTSVEFIASGGDVNAPRVTNGTPSPAAWLEYNTVLTGADQSVLLDVRTSIASLETQNHKVVTGKVRYSGARQWFELYPGTNNISYSATSDAGSSSAILRFRPPYV